MSHRSLSIRALVAFGAMYAPLTAPAAGQSPDTDIFLGELRADGASIAFGSWTNVTDRPGYDNQPSFTPDSRAILYTVQSGGQTDIHRYDIGEMASSPVTTTPESEYSATVMPGGDRFSVIRVEADSTQRLWSFRMDGSSPELVLVDVAPVGYHAWLDDSTLGLFVLGQPATLQIADAASGEASVRAHDIGRSLHRVPGRAAVSFLHRDGGIATIRTLDPATGSTRVIAQPVDGSQDYAWTPDGVLIMGAGSRLFALDPLTDSEWREVADLGASGIDGITRLAVSRDGRHIAVVAAGG